LSPFIKNLFTTPVFTGVVNNTQITQSICDLAYKYKSTAKDARLVSDSWNFGKKSSDQKDFNEKGITSFCSTEDLFNSPEWNHIAQFIINFAMEMLEPENNNKDQLLTLQNMWTTIYPKGAFVPQHIHSNTLLSGVFYAKASPNCGGLSFQDPAYIAKTMYANDFTNFPTVLTRYVESAETGKMIIFPGWLPHESLPNNSEDDRIIIGFNINMINKSEYDQYKIVNSNNDLKRFRPIMVLEK
jgi:hypothetical protein